MHSGRRLLSLIDQLLQITKIETGKRTFTLRDVNVQFVVRHCINALQPMADAAGVHVVVDIESPHTAAVRADSGALEQILTNLVSNAIKYNHRDGEVRLIYRAVGELGELAVIDTGSGITDSQKGRMYEPFDRLGADRSAVPGVGLGLVITKQLVEAMKGTIHVHSEVGVGSTFTLQLPASSAREALTKVGSYQPDIIVSDIGMPEADGYWLLTELRSLSPEQGGETPAIALTAYASAEDRARSLSCGFDVHLPKPVDAGDLAKAIAIATGRVGKAFTA